MFRTTSIALAAASALGTSVASAGPFNVTSIATTAEANALQRVMWYRYRPNVFFVRHRDHRHPADTRMPGAMMCATCEAGGATHNCSCASKRTAASDRRCPFLA
jgi:hypothetical protein